MEKSQLYMTVKEAAQLWGVTEDTVRRWCREEKIGVFPQKDESNRRWFIPRGAKRPESKTKQNRDAK